MKTNGIEKVFLWTSDMERAVAFYRDVLELELLYRGGNDWAEFRAGAINLALHGWMGSGADLPRPHGSTVVFEVDDLDVAKLALKEQGVELVHEGEVEGISRFVEFHDPDGNELSVIEYAARTST